MNIFLEIFEEQSQDWYRSTVPQNILALFLNNQWHLCFEGKVNYVFDNVYWDFIYIDIF